jgi:beta-glucosidase
MFSIMILPAVVALSVLWPPARAAPDWPWYNVSLSQETRLNALVNAMTATELVTQLVKYSQRIERLGVPQYAWHMEAAHGVAAPGNESSFPCSLARAAAFDPEMEQLIGRATGEEARAKWNQYRLDNHGATPPYHSQGISLTTYAPEINLCRDPRWGRCQVGRYPNAAGRPQPLGTLIYAALVIGKSR